MSLPESYTNATLAFYMVTSLGGLAELLGLDESSMTEAINDVALSCGVTDISTVTDVARVRAVARVAALRLAQTAVAGWYDFTADGGSYKRSQVTAQLDRMLASAEAGALLYDGVYAVEVGTITFTNDPYAWTDDTEAEGVA